MNQDFQIRHESKHYRPCNQYKYRFHRSHHRSLLGGRSVKLEVNLDFRPQFISCSSTYLGQNETESTPHLYIQSALLIPM